jgi:beta-lactamase superfamily II metal-dependent hydrolase
VVLSAGYRNSFGHPHGRVITRYGEFARKTLNAAQGGMISFEFSEKINKMETRRIKLFTLANTGNGILDIGIKQTCN